MEDTIKSSIIQFRRLYVHCIDQVNHLTRDDFVKKNKAYFTYLSYESKLQELYDEILNLVKDSPGVLTQSQLDSITSAINEYKSKSEKLMAIPEIHKVENSKTEEKENKPNPVEQPKRDFESMSLAEMRSLLGLDTIRAQSNDSVEAKHKQDQMKESIMNEIIDRTSRIKEVGNAINESVKESSKALDSTSSLQDHNLNEVKKQTSSILEIRSSFCGSIFRDLKYLMLAAIIFFICFMTIFILPKPK